MTELATEPVTIPAGYRFTSPGHCRTCDAPIAWCKTRAGKNAPMDPDGKSHWSTCPQAAEWRQKVAAKGGGS